MELTEAIKVRHSVRQYLDKPIKDEIRQELQTLTGECNEKGGLNIQLIWDEPKAFDSFMARYGKFSGVTNYVALIAKKGCDEKIGYYGEKIVLAAQALGLNTCWVAMTYKKIKSAFTINKGEKLYCVLALGYGETQGVPHKVKSIKEVSRAENAPQWFIDGVNAALLAPTAMNQQKFVFSFGDIVTATTKAGFYSKIDLGIAKYHFEIGAKKQIFDL